MQKNGKLFQLIRKYHPFSLIRKYHLFFLIAVTFLIEAIILMRMQNQEIGIELIVTKTTQLSILMLGTAFFYLLIDALLSFKKNKTDSTEEFGEIEEEERSKDNDQSGVNGQVDKCKKSDFAGALTRLLIGSFSASTIPTGLSLILCAFYDKALIQHMSGVEIYIAFAGFSLVSIAVLSTYEEKERMEGEIRKIRNPYKARTMLE